MSTPDDEPGERGGRDPGGRRRGDARRLVLVATGVLAATAAGVVVWSDDARLLRLGVVAALWATMLVVVTLLRRPADPDALRRTYEAELAGEVAARREHELTVEQSLRRELERERSGEIEALRGEVERLRTALEQRGPEAVAAGVPEPPPEPRLQVVNGLPATPSPPSPPSPPSRPPRPSERPPERGRTGPGGPTGPGHDRPPLRPVATPPEQHPERPLAARRWSAGPGDGPGTALNGSARARGTRSGDPVVAPYASWEPAEASDPPGLPPGSFVDHYLGATGRDPHAAAAPGGAASSTPPEAWRSPDTTGRTVAELLAAHAAAPEPHRRRRDG